VALVAFSVFFESPVQFLRGFYVADRAKETTTSSWSKRNGTNNAHLPPPFATLALLLPNYAVPCDI